MAYICPQMEMRCITCGVKFFTARYKALKGKGKYCTRKCVRSVNLKQHSQETILGKQHPGLRMRWRNMIYRCHDENCTAYKYYGARGVSVCDEWKNDFLAFLNWATTNGYAPDLTIDRIDNDGRYEPGNCRWVTMKVQNQNKRRRGTVTPVTSKRK